MADPEALYVDIHEPADIEALLQAAGVPTVRKALAPGDYVVGEVGVERKTVRDFFASLVDRRLFDQLDRLREVYPRALLLVEGDLRLVEEYRNPKALWGAFLALHLEEGVPVLFAPDARHTALILETAYRRLGRQARGYGLRHKPRLRTLEERQEFAVQGLPSVGAVLSRVLLERFGSVRRVMRASERELRKVPHIGPLKAAQIAALLDAPYAGHQDRLHRE